MVIKLPIKLQKKSPQNTSEYQKKDIYLQKKEGKLLMN